MSDPIDSYSDAVFPWKRKSTLYPDRIEVTGSGFFSTDFHSTVPLSLLSERIDRVFFRTQVFSGGFSLLVIGLIASAVAYLGPSLSTLPRRYSMYEFLAFCIPIIAITMILLAARKVEVAHFIGATGFSHFDLCRSGPDRARFDAFVTQILEAMRKHRAQAEGAPQSQQA